jgi:hypothetical protein
MPAIHGEPSGAGYWQFVKQPEEIARSLPPLNAALP